MPGEDHYRIVGVFPEDSDQKEGEILYEEIERQILEDTQLQLDIYKVKWFSTYKVHSRRVNKFSAGRCFVAGDAAHIHSPAGAQGMNTGIQDAYNLAWKLALVLRGDANSHLLETYNEERVEVAKRLLETTDRFFEFAVDPDWLLSFTRLYIFPRVANLMVSLDSVNQFIFPLISQIGITYRGSSLSLKTGGGDHFEVKAGDRMPYFLIDGKSVYDWLHAAKFHLLTFSNEVPQAISEDVEQEFPGSVDYHTFRLNEQVAEIFGSDRSFSVLLRPDNYIAFVSSTTPVSQLRSYFDTTIR
jgi:hypothetical protein